ncbi:MULTISPECIES: TonB-dependent receptor [Butyricimonas]|uniref:TonB-dependent receptor n=2 Tax=Odoribacteraceae TaxID=1853231 RepID=UPI001D05D49C|nr:MULTISPECIES: TonB-dependent receptor [Butyricimonas]MCB6973228.1 TonB-dependent receptor [Butyricimonas synergistica]MCG4519854.1 TonB-dependent receptor [Butyricimonas sp. DFI.6.44]
MRFGIYLLLLTTFVANANGFSQNTRVTLDLKQRSMLEIIQELRKTFDYRFLYRGEDLEKCGKRDLKVKDAGVDEVMNQLLYGTGLTWRLEDGVVLIKASQAKAVEPEKKSIRLKGFVYDTKKQPIPGVTVKVSGVALGTSTNADGWFALDLPMLKGTLEFSFIGFKRETLDFFERTAKDTLRVTMKEESQELDETVVVAFGTQKKESVVSAITTVRPMDLKSSNSDLTSSFAGKIAGMIGWQTGGLPAALTEEEMNTKFYIRGITSFQTGANIDPLILLDGVESSKLDLARIAPEDIESFSVMKDASATAMYGARGANGVILVTTKKGQEGSVYASVRYESIFSMPTKELDVVDPINYMKMYNQALLSRDPSATPKYSVERINRTISGKYPSWVYPANDWYKMMFKDYNTNHHLGVNIRGGGKVIQYYASVNYNRDMGMLKTDKLNDFDCNITNNQTSFRVNLNIDLKAGIKLLVNSSTTIDKYHGPLQNVAQAYQLAFNASPVDFAPLYPGDDTYNWPHLRFGSTSSNQINPYMLLQKGYLERTRYSTTNRAEYIHNLSTLIKGLEVRASVSVAQSGYYTTGYSTDPARYSLLDYDFETGKHILNAISAGNRTLSLDDKSTKSTTDTRVTYEARLLHTAAWDEHQTSLTAVFQATEHTYTPIEMALDGMPQRNLTFSMRGTYGFKDRYFIEGSFGYNGSERFAKHNRMGFFPAVGMAWVTSSEPFMSSVSSVIDFLKFRASYGKVGNDGIISSPRFAYAPSFGASSGYFDPQAGSGGRAELMPQQVINYGNDNIKWEIAEQLNFGLETKFFKGLVELNIDAYQEIRHNIIGYRSNIPANTGIAYEQLANIGKSRSRGIDFSGKIQHAFNKDLWVILNGTFTYNKVIYRAIEEATEKPDWQRKVGKEISQPMGYIAEGLFQDEAEIKNSPKQNGDVMPGDIRYRDINGDGYIDVNDATFIGFPETPGIIYGFQGFVNYKNFEFNFAFQGAGRRSFFMDPRKLSPFVDDHAMLTAIYKDHWSDDNMAKKPFWPRLSTYNLVAHNPEEDWYNSKAVETRKSTYFMRSCHFLRCTSLELAYNMPQNLMKRWKLQNMKFFVRANNPFLFSNFKVWDVELGEDGFNYPIQKTYALGLNFSF